MPTDRAARRCLHAARALAARGTVGAHGGLARARGRKASCTCRPDRAAIRCRRTTAISMRAWLAGNALPFLPGPTVSRLTLHPRWRRFRPPRARRPGQPRSQTTRISGTSRVFTRRVTATIAGVWRCGHDTYAHRSRWRSRCAWAGGRRRQRPAGAAAGSTACRIGSASRGDGPVGRCVHGPSPDDGRGLRDSAQGRQRV